LLPWQRRLINGKKKVRSDLDYADDITLFVDKPEGLSNALETMEQYLPNLDFTCHGQKQKYRMWELDHQPAL